MHILIKLESIDVSVLASVLRIEKIITLVIPNKEYWLPSITGQSGGAEAVEEASGAVDLYIPGPSPNSFVRSEFANS